ncbi:hypothetical protein F4779DRAFT_579514 [Xylariaceae sp. FL0662B]|nr:hypothetical protein F4779DRAFT_579514 [Xylariaceae sp. FL0662B]
MSSDTYYPAFGVFNNLPFELRTLIWEYALPEDIPEVCIPWPLDEGPTDPDINNAVNPNTTRIKRSKYISPLLVDTCFPVLMHVCRESREVALRLRFRYSPVAGCPVPFRSFRPDIDILYVSVCRSPNPLNAVEWGPFPEGARGARHVALDLHSVGDGRELWTLVTDPFLDVQTVTCVLPAPNALIDTALRFRPPVRRCRLREVLQPSHGGQSHIISVDRGIDRRMSGLSTYLEEIQDTIAQEFASWLDDNGVPFRLSLDRLPASLARKWDPREPRFKLKFSAQLFEEYRGGQWAPNSDYKILFQFQRTRNRVLWAGINNAKVYQVGELEKWTPLRDPEKFRVNDIQQDEVRI